MKNALLLAPYFLPRRRVGAWRPFKFAIHLKEFGWQPHIITIKEPGGRLTAKEQQLLEGIPIHKITPPFDFTQKSGSSIESSDSANSSSSDGLFDSLASSIDRNFPIDTWLPLFWLRKGFLFEKMKHIQPRVIWSTGDPWSSHWLGRKTAQKFDIPWVADFRDPWTLGGVDLKERTAFSRYIDKRAEQAVMQDASKITFTSQQTEQLYQQHYADINQKTATLYNCFDRMLYDDTEENLGLFDNDKLNLLFFGKFRKLSPARPLVDILAVLKQENEQDLPVAVHSFGPLSAEDRRYAAQQGVLNCFVQQSPIPAEQALNVLPKADILWLSTEPARQNIIPAKLWDYLAAGQPILSIAPNPEIADILAETGAGIQLSHQNPEEVAEIIQQSMLAKQQGKPLPIAVNYREEKIEQYEAQNVTKRLAAIFDELS